MGETMKTLSNNKLFRRALATMICGVGMVGTMHGVINRVEIWRKQNGPAICLVSDSHIEQSFKALEESVDIHLKSFVELVRKMCSQLGAKQVSLVVEDMRAYKNRKSFQLPPGYCRSSGRGVLPSVLQSCKRAVPKMRAVSSDCRLTIEMAVTYLDAFLDNLKQGTDAARAKEEKKQTKLFCQLKKITGKCPTIRDILRQLEPVCAECEKSTGCESLDQYLQKQCARIREVLLTPLKELSNNSATALCSLMDPTVHSRTKMGLFSQKLDHISADLTFVEMISLREIVAAEKQGRKLVFAIMGGQHARNVSEELKKMGYTQTGTKVDTVIGQYARESSPSQEFTGALVKYPFKQILDSNTPDPVLRKAAPYATTISDEQIVKHTTRFMQDGCLFSAVAQHLHTQFNAHA